MNNKHTYLKCTICGNLIELINDSGVLPVCCGQPMQHLVPNTVDAAAEKHLPEITRNGNCIKITVGSVQHPMLPEHYIEWIVLVQGNRMQRVQLNPSDQPEAVFECTTEPVTVYAHCNLHGLWMRKA